MVSDHLSHNIWKVFWDKFGGHRKTERCKCNEQTLTPINLSQTKQKLDLVQPRIPPFLQKLPYIWLG